MKKTATRSALFTSFISLLLCVSMLVGTTFAWFTDSVVSGNNKIIAGNLDVEVYYGDPANKNSIQDVETLFDDVKLWEPGAMAWEQLTVVNEGTLALKYNMTVNFSNATDNGKGKTLADILQVAIMDEKPTRENIKTAKLTYMKDFVLDQANQPMLPGASEGFYMAIYWAPSAIDNEFNMNNGNRGKELSIDLGINLVAAQLTHEVDSFDKYYDESAAVFTVEEAQALLDANKDANLVNANAPEKGLEVPANYTGTLVLNNVNLAYIREKAAISTRSTLVAGSEQTGATVPAGGQIVILGNVRVVATEDGMSAISGTKLNITGNGKLTAIAKGQAAFGIGGMTTESIKISNVTIQDVQGGFVGGVGTDTKYYKDAPEGGAAIGSGRDGAVITLDKVNIVNAVGGSKAAGIGARYHVGVTVNITDSTIAHVEGGVSAAGIGGSRVSSGASESGVTINIRNSTITAKGGVYGAGIGSGYDTHCQAKQPLCTIHIENSTINATGGKYAAGVGTGYHNAALAGEIKNSTVKAVSGEKFYKSEYSAAMDIGFGVTDPTREGQQKDSKLTYNGKDITLEDVPEAAGTNKDLSDALANGATTIGLGAGAYSLPTLSGKEGVTIEGSEGTVIGGENAATGFGGNFGKNNTYKNLSFEGSSNGVRYSYGNGGTVTFEDCSFKGDSTYGFHMDQSNGGTLIFNNCTFSGFNAFASDLVKVTFNNCEFLHNGYYGHTNIWSVGEFNNCTWGDGASVSTKGNSAKLYFDGVEESYHHEYVGSAESLVAFKDSVADGDAWKGQKVVLVDDIDLGGVAWDPTGNFGGTFDGNGHTISDLTVSGTSSVGFFKKLNSTAVVQNVIFDKANISGEHYVGTVVGWEGNESANAVIRNVTVRNSTITCNTDAANDNGDKAGAIAGYAVTLTIDGCTVENTTVKAYRDFGGILGYANGSGVIVKNNTVENVTLVIDNDVNYKNYTTDAAHDANPVVGEIAGNAKVENNTVK